MNALRRRPWLALAILAAVLRMGTALLTERLPIFPAYYYTDAEIMDNLGWNVAQAWRRGEAGALPVSVSQRVQGTLLAGLYTAVGHRPLAAKIAMALAGSLAVAALYLACLPGFGPSAAFLTAGLVALWPSHIFFTSQNFKDALVLLLCYLALAAYLRLMSEDGPAEPAALLGGTLCLLFVGLLRLPVLCVVSCALLAGFGLRLALGPRRRAALGAAALLAACASFAPFSRALLSGPLTPSARFRDLPSVNDVSLGVSIEPRGLPARLSAWRRQHQDDDRLWARLEKKREISTTLFYGLEFQGWLDLLLFLPKGMFYVMFMPLPFLYPLGRNIGRILASGENVALLCLAAAALAGALRGPKRPERLAFLMIFLASAAGSALMELDLGGAMRHRLLYLPLIFPFAFSGVERKARAGRRKVLQVLECGGPGGTGNQVAALCNALDVERFDVVLAYAVRPGGSPEAYRAQARGAARAFFIPELAREIAPLRDARALWRLYRLFQEEQPDIVHLHSSKAGFVGRLAARLAGVPRVFYSPHGYGFLQEDRSALSRAVYRLAELSVSWIGTIVAVSPSEAELARPLCWGRKVETVCDAYLGELPAEGGLLGHEGTIVGSCGRITAARNPDAWIGLAQRLTDSRNNLKCVWIGGGEQEDSMRRHLEDMNLLAKVEVTGWLEPAEARRRLRGLDLFVHYSRWDALPNAALEAMALGLPVVASDVPGCRDVVVDGETGFLARNEVELLERCHLLVDDPDLRRKLGAAGRRRVAERFAQDKALSGIEALYSI